MRPGRAGWECKCLDDVPAFAVSKQMLKRADSSALVAGRMMGAMMKVDEQNEAHDLSAYKHKVYHVIVRRRSTWVHHRDDPKV